jgi:ABC-type transporter Mla maintaining outer membrane lipid asymmetry ATPase subunit MlaF
VKETSGLSAAGAKSPVVESSGLAVGTGGASDSVLLQEVEWTIQPGDYWVVGGPPGSGKSDLLATVAGLYRPMRGTLKLFAKDTAELSEEEFLNIRLRIGLVFENGGRLFHHLTVGENVALPLRYHQNCSSVEVEDRVEALLETTGLTRFTDARAGQVKSGWRQRVGLARALALQPELLLLDNPLAGIGPQEARWWREFLSRLVEGHELMGNKPVTLVAACHDLRPWADQGKQFALLKQQRWMRVGGREELACSAEPLLRELLAADFGPATS